MTSADMGRVHTDTVPLERDLWTHLVHVLDGDRTQIESIRERLIALAPQSWDADLADDGGTGWLPIRPVIAPTDDHGGTR